MCEWMFAVIGFIQLLYFFERQSAVNDRAYINTPREITAPGNEVYIGSVHEKIGETGEMTDQATIEFLDKVVTNFIEFYNKTTAATKV